MKKKDWLLVISLVFIVFAIDYLSKLWALNNINSLKFHGILGLVLHRNPGAMLGAFSDLPPVLRVVSLSTGGSFLIFIYCAIQYLLPKRSLILRIGMSLLLGGILGNVFDRIISGSVIDFILFRFGDWISPAFNLADAIQWIGYFLVVYTLIVHGEQIWPTKDDRKQIWVIPKYQIKYIAVMISVGLTFTLISGVFSYTFIKIVIDDLVSNQPEMIEKKFLTPFMITYTCMSLSFVVVLYLISRIISHRTAGPVFAFEKYINDLLDGSERKLRFRDGDELRHLEKTADRLHNRLKSS